MSKHTAGPWKQFLSGHGASEKHVVTDKYNRDLLNRNHDEAEANAKLIATAPELLKVLETIASSKRSDGAYDKRDMAGAIVIAQRAIDKANK